METLRYVVLANGLLAVVSLAYYALLQRETFFAANRLVLWLGLLASLSLPLLELPDWRPQPVRAVMQQTAKALVPGLLSAPPVQRPDITVTYPNRQTYRAFSSRPSQSGWSWQMGLMAVYGAVALLLLLRFGIRLTSLLRLIGRSVHEEYNDFVLVRNETAVSPFSFFRWVVVNPARHTTEELEQILRHERVHVRGWHSLDMIGAELVCIILWFNPAAYLFRYQLQQTLEFAADRAVLAEGVDAKTYQYNLVKVSLATGQSTFTNHFGASQLKPRIAMLNKRNSSKTAWIKYPVLCIGVFAVLAAFAGSNSHKFERFVSRPTRKASVDIAKNEVNVQPVVKPDPPVSNNPVKPETLPDRTFTTLSQPVTAVNSATKPTEVEPTRRSPTRFILYKGNYLYWVVTPKTTLDDFAVMKQEFAKHGLQMQLNEIKFDPLYVFIDRIALTVVRPSGGMTRCDETDDDDKPIPSIAGFAGIGPKVGSSGTGGIRYYGTEFPEALHKMAADDEAATAQFIRDRRIEYMVVTGTKKFAHLGSGSSTYPNEYFAKTPTNSVLLVLSGGSLQIPDKLRNTPIFINNEPVDKEAVGLWNIRQLYKVVVKSQNDQATQKSITSALLIYVNEDL